MGVDSNDRAVDVERKNRIEGPAGMSESEICVQTVNLIPILVERMRIARRYRDGNDAERKLKLASISS